MFNDLFDKSSYDIFSKNYSFLLSINPKEYLNNINYQQQHRLCQVMEVH